MPKIKKIPLINSIKRVKCSIVFLMYIYLDVAN